MQIETFFKDNKIEFSINLAPAGDINDYLKGMATLYIQNDNTQKTECGYIEFILFNHLWTPDQDIIETADGIDQTSYETIYYFEDVKESEDFFNETIAYLDTVLIKKKYRNQGLGEFMITNFKSLIRRLGASVVVAKSYPFELNKNYHEKQISIDLLRLKRFYKKCNFKVYHKIKKRNSIYMYCDLTVQD